MTIRYEVFLASATFYVPPDVTALDAILVAGGGGGGGKASTSGGRPGGGGGAGGVLQLTSHAVTPQASIAVTVGAGGAGGIGSSSTAATSGGNSVFNGQTATGGGAGGGIGQLNGQNGGSGGGRAHNGSTAGTGVSGQGNNGGLSVSNWAGGGGGGQSAVGGNASGTSDGTNIGGSGGAGLTLSSIGWTPSGAPASVGGGGGGGAQSATGTPGVGGIGGGGNGNRLAGGNGFPGVANTGGGGGGCGGGGTGVSNGGAGGSGIVILRYSSSSYISDVQPRRGPQTGGPTITITGEGFLGATGVLFGAASATGVVIVNDNLITCTLPANVVGTYDVTVQHPSGDMKRIAVFSVYTLRTNRTTQIPIYVVSGEAVPVNITQIPILVVIAEEQSTRITQMPINVALEVLPPAPPEPIPPLVPIGETWSWKTSTIRGLNNQEQRLSLMAQPRVAYDYVLPVTKDEERQAVIHLLYRYQGEAFEYPLYAYSARVMGVSPGDTEIDFSHAHTDIRAGYRAALLTADYSLVEYVDVTSVDADGATLAAPIKNTIGVGLIVPVRDFKLRSDGVLTMLSNTGTSSLPLDMQNAPPLINPQDQGVVTVYDGMPIMPEPFEVSSGVDESYLRPFDRANSGLTDPVDVIVARNSLITTNRLYVIDRSAISDWKALGMAISGAQKAFLLPTWRNDFELAAPVALGSAVLTPASQIVREYVAFGAWKYLRLESQNGVIYRRIVSMSIDLETGYPTLTLNASIGATPGDNQFRRLSLVARCVLADDQIEVSHNYNYALVNLNVRGVNE